MDSATERDEAAELYAQAIELELRRDYANARKCYEQSLQLHEDEEVRSAYLRLLSIMGPM